MELLHPIRLMARTDAELCTVLHSFFLFHEEQGKLVLDCRHPQVRKNIETVEEGLKGLISESLSNASLSRERAQSFVITNHDGRLYVFVRQTKNAVIALVSTLPIMHFCRSFLDQLDVEPSEMLLPLIYGVCEMPIFPLPNLHYSYLFSGGKQLEISFSSLEYVDDLDMDLVVQMIMTPTMIVRAWEALIVERRILVVARNDALLLPCCEFLRRLVAPMPFTGTFIPNLPHSGFEAVEAPGTFIIGAQVEALCESNQDLTGLVVLNLDKQTVTNVTSTADDPYYNAPPFLISKLIDAVTSIMIDPLAAWCNRLHDGEMRSPQSPEEMHKRTMEVLNVFMQTNMTILSAQFCSIRAFFRSSYKVSDRVQACFQGMKGYCDQVSQSFGCFKLHDVVIGCLQRWSECDDSSPDVGCLSSPSWIEADSRAFAVYDFADSLPTLLFPLEELEAVLASTEEPDGHVFDIVLRNQQIYRFASTDKASRSVWMGFIEQKIKSRSAEAPNACIAEPATEQLPSLSNCSALLLARPADSDFSDVAVLNKYLDFRDVIRNTQAAMTLLMSPEYSTFAHVMADDGQDIFSFVSPDHCFEANLRPFLKKSHASTIVDAMLSAQQSNIKGEPLDRTFNQIFSPKEMADLVRSPTEGESLSPTRGSQILVHRMFRIFSRKSQSARTSSVTEPSLSSFDSDRDLKKQYVAECKESIQSVCTVHHRCLVDLNQEILEDRLKTYKALAVGDDSTSERLSLQFNLVDIVHQHTLASPALAAHADSSGSSNDSVKAVALEQRLLSLCISSRSKSMERAVDVGDDHCSIASEEVHGYEEESDTAAIPVDGREREQDGEHENSSGDVEVSEMSISPCDLSFQVEEDNPYRAACQSIGTAITTYLANMRDKMENLQSQGFEEKVSIVVDHLIGCAQVAQGAWSGALQVLGKYNVVDQRVITRCLVHEFARKAFPLESFSETEFVSGFAKTCRRLAFHAVRLCLELVHCELHTVLGGPQYGLDPLLSLSTLRIANRSNRVLVRGRKAHIAAKGVQLAWEENDKPSDALNEAVLCTTLDTMWSPCDIVANLLTNLRELLKVYALSSSAQKYTTIVNGDLQLQLRPQVLREIAQLSSFKKFEIETSQLQKLDITGLSVSHRLAFFLNLFNLLMTHALARRGGQGSGMAERQTFQRLAKYNVGGYYFSLIDIKFGILRSASAAPVIVGPLSIDWNFAQGDPRRQFVLTEAFPNISWCIFQGSATSPPLVVITNADNVEDEILRYSRRYLLRTVYCDITKKSVLLPDIFRTYWSDFGRTKHEVIRYIGAVAGPQFRDRLGAFFKATNSQKIRVDFIPSDWTPTIVLALKI